VGDAATMLQYDGAAWSPMAAGSATMTTLAAIGGSSFDNVYAVGYDRGDGCPGVILHYGDDDDDNDDNDDNDNDNDNDDATPLLGYDDGDTMPDFTLTSNGGAPVSLSAYRGRIVLLDSSAMWRRYCRYETPLLETQFYQPYQNQGPGLMVLQLLGQDCNYATPTVAELQAWGGTTYGLAFPVLADANFQVGNQINDGGIPFFWVLDANMVIVAKSDDGGNYHDLSYFGPIVRQLLGLGE
jgi:hypothetical protein